MQTSALKSQKTSDSLGDLYVDDWEKWRRIGTSILYLVFCHFQRSDWGFIKFKKQGQRDKLDFCLQTRPQDLKD